MSDYLVSAALPAWRQLAALRLLHLAGWQVRYKALPGPHGLLVVYPHTSNWDFIVGLLTKWAIGLPFRFLGKDSLFKGPLGVVMRHWGGMAVERATSSGATERLAAAMRAEPWCWIAITPEATRGYKPHWRSGFYHLARAARVPLLLVYMDYPNKEVGLVDSLMLSGDQGADMAAIARAYAGRHGRFAQLEAPIVLAPPRER